MNCPPPYPYPQNKLAWVPWLNRNPDWQAQWRHRLQPLLINTCGASSMATARQGLYLTTQDMPVCAIFFHRDMAFSCPEHHFGWCLHLNRYTVELPFPQDGIRGHRRGWLCLLTGGVQNHPRASWSPFFCWTNLSDSVPKRAPNSLTQP